MIKINDRSSESLLTIKFVGNEGTHRIGKLSREYIIKSYKIMEHILNKIFDKTEQEIILLQRALKKKYENK